ncbi:MAG: hypothetical protein V2B19_00680 [Pseudomonadota bacterium]
MEAAALFGGGTREVAAAGIRSSSRLKRANTLHAIALKLNVPAIAIADISL